MAQLISVVMPAYNAATYIGEAIASVQAQTYLHWELLVVDDGSTDSTAAVVVGFSRLDARVRYVYQSNAKQGRARNNGIAHAQGELIAFLDADDIWLPHKLAVQVAALTTDGIDLVFSDSYVFRDLCTPVASLPLLGAGRGRYAGKEAIRQLAGQNFIPILTVLTTKAALARGYGFDENATVQYGEDYHLWLRMLLNGAVFLGLEEPLAAYRLSSASVTAYDNQNFTQLIGGVANMKATFPQHRRLLHAGIDNHIRRSGIDMLLPANDSFFYTSLDQYFAATGRGYWRPIFSSLHVLRARKLALRAAYFIFNYL
jgi:glycosyltransferase involved in cell wall biosynthesis